MPVTRKAKQPRRRVINNHDGGAKELVRRVPADWDRLARESVGVLAGTQVDTLFWHIGSHAFVHDTKVGEFRGDAVTGTSGGFQSVTDWRHCENCKRLIEEGRDILKGIVEEGHNAGLEVFASLRMNDIHDSHYVERMGSFKTQHPEYLLGDSVEVYARGRPWKFSPRTCLDYAIPEVRALKMGIIREILDEYDVDGLELDWTRHAWAFRPGEELTNLGIMNEFTREVRRHIDATAARKGRPMFLAAAVPAPFDPCREIGLDVQKWVDEGLIDILIAAGPSFAMPLQEFREATRKVGCQLFSRLIRQSIFKTPEVVRAAAATHYLEGVDGIYLFNYYNSPHDALINEIGDMKVLERLDKHYVLSKRLDQFASYVHTVSRPAPSTEPLPVSLTPSSAGKGQAVLFKVADDIESAARDKAIEEIKLMLKLENFCLEEDVVRFRLNEQPLENYELPDDVVGSSYWFSFHLDGPPLKRGENELEVILERRNPRIMGAVVLSDVELIVRYK